jgi:hypothetical protein
MITDYFMKKTVVILWLLLISGCKTPPAKQPESGFDIAIKNLSASTERLDSIRREKDFFIKSLEDFERQKAEYGQLLDYNDVRSQMQHFAEWHRDIAKRERALEFRHALNVLAAHHEVIKQKAAEPNQDDLQAHSPAKP